MTIKNKELHRLNITIGIFMTLMIIFFSLAVSKWFYFGLLLVLAIMSKTSGVQFDIVNKKYRIYKHFCFWTRGEWKEIDTNKNLVILIKQGVQTTSGTMMTGSLETKGEFSELYLMNESHTRRFFIDSSENHNKIELLTIKLSQLLNIEIKPYNPKT